MKSILLSILLVFTGSSFSQTKIGVIDRQKLIDSLPSRKMNLKEMEQLEINIKKEHAEMDSYIIAKSYELSNNRKTWSADVIFYEENLIATMKDRFAMRKSQIEVEVKMLNEEYNRSYDDKIRNATAIVSKKLSLDLVVDKNDTFYFKEKLDITTLVLKELLVIDKSNK